MQRIQPVNPESAPEASKPLLAAVHKKLGRIPNLMGTLAQAPAALASYLALSESLSAGLFHAKERERIALAVAQANQCDYCLAAHTAIGKSVGLTSDETNQARAGTAEDPKQAALVVFARLLTEQRGVVADNALRAFRSAGWSDAHAVEVVAHVALNTLTNYLNHLAGTEVDFPAAPVLQPA